MFPALVEEAGDLRNFARLLLPLHYPFAVRVATWHHFRQFESEVRVQSLDLSISPALMSHAARIKIEALLRSCRAYGFSFLVVLLIRKCETGPRGFAVGGLHSFPDINALGARLAVRLARSV